MMKVFGFTLLFVIIGIVSGAPSTARQSGEPDACIKECINGVLQYGEELSILKNPNLSKYFSKLDEVCEVLATARNCVQNCGASSNPFSLESLNIVCQPEAAERISVIRQCMRYIDSNVDVTCTKECAENSRVVDETDVTPKMNPLMEKASSECSAFKCMAHCTIGVVNNECGQEMGKELQGLLQYVVDTQHKDLTKMNLIEAMTKTTPPQCNYLYDPSVLFGAVKEDPKETHDPTEDAKALYAQAQLQLLLKQIELAEKQDHLMDRENAKLDMEMAYMAHKAQQRDARFFHAQHAVPMFVPEMAMEKPPKMAPMAESHQVEDMNNQPEPSKPMPESAPMEAHPPMHEEEPHQQEMPEELHQQEMPEEPHQQEMPEEPHQQEMPEEPHQQEMPEEPHQPMSEEPHQPMPMEAHPPMIEEPHQQEMPMEAHPPMPMPMEAIIISPQHHSSHKQPMSAFPIPAEGEQLPLEFVPVAMPMPMEAMPRFF